MAAVKQIFKSRINLYFYFPIEVVNGSYGPTQLMRLWNSIPLKSVPWKSLFGTRGTKMHFGNPQKYLLIFTTKSIEYFKMDTRHIFLTGLFLLVILYFV